MKNYIIITDEGFTFQPCSESVEPDIENCQVIGFSSGGSEVEAFTNLVKENPYLLETNFDKLIFYELAFDYENTSSRFFLSDVKGTLNI